MPVAAALPAELSVFLLPPDGYNAACSSEIAGEQAEVRCPANAKSQPKNRVLARRAARLPSLRPANRFPFFLRAESEVALAEPGFTSAAAPILPDPAERATGDTK